MASFYRLAALTALTAACFCHPSTGQRNETRATDSDTPLHLLQPDYPVPYGKVSPEKTTELLQRIHRYLDQVTPPQLVDKRNGAVISTYTALDENAVFAKSDFRLNSYEWGVTYGAMLLASEVTGDPRYKKYTDDRLGFLARVASPALQTPGSSLPGAMKSYLKPHALDDGGALTAAMIKTLRAGNPAPLRPLIDHFVNYIRTKEYKLADGTLARNRPQPNTLWLDDLYMGVPTLAQMGKLTGEATYYDEAVRQVLQFSERMFDKQKGLYLHGWVEGMNVHPAFHWGRANGWALLTKVELLDVLPEGHPQRPKILALLQAHIRRLASCQSGSGFWHQLLDRNDSYLETSATAIYAYCIAKAINKGWIDGKAHAPACLLAWHAVSTKISDRGQVEGTCVGTGMGFDPAFYYHRPISPFAAHGYGPVLLAGAEVLRLLNSHSFDINDSSLQMTSN